MFLNEMFLTEGRDAPLYHAVTIDGAISILNDNCLRGNTIHGHPQQKNKQIVGVSLTRSLAFAYYWANVVFVLDQWKLSRRFKIEPFHYFSSKEFGRSSHGEYEEFVIGSIKPLKKYLLAIRTCQSNLDSLKEISSQGDTTVDIVINHPLLVVDSDAIYKRYYQSIELQNTIWV